LHDAVLPCSTAGERTYNKAKENRITEQGHWRFRRLFTNLYRKAFREKATLGGLHATQKEQRLRSVDIDINQKT